MAQHVAALSLDDDPLESVDSAAEVTATTAEGAAVSADAVRAALPIEDEAAACIAHWEDSDGDEAAGDAPPPPTLFLDVDGVLNTAQMFGLHALHPKLRERLKGVVEATECRIVLSTTWRLTDAHERVLRDALIEAGIPARVVVGRTPALGLADLRTCDRTNIQETRRATEIMRYLDNEPAVARGRWAVVDDLGLLRVADEATHRRLAGHFVRTAVESGLTPTCCGSLCAILRPSE